MNHPADMFDTPAIWKTDPIEAFSAFVASTEFVEMSHRKPSAATGSGKAKKLMPLRASSVAVYRHMWRNFVNWTREEGLHVLDAEPDQLMAFLEHRNEQGRRALEGATIRRQYLMLLERVYRHLRVQPNPATHACFDIFRRRTSGLAGRNAPTAILTGEQQQCFLDALPCPPRDEANPRAGWKQRRDRAMQALMLGAGVKVAEAIGMYVDNIGTMEADGSAQVTISPAAAGGTVRWHVTMLRPPATSVVLEWAAERRALGIPGPLLFPARETGGRMEKTAVYRRVKKTFEEAGIAAARRGGRTLRNAYAVRELGEGAAVETVGEYLGHRKRRSMETYEKALGAMQSRTGKT